MANLFEAEPQYDRMKEVVRQGIAAQFPFEGKKNDLRLVRAWVEDLPDRTSKRKAKAARLEEGLFSSPVLGHVQLVDKQSGKVLDEVRRMQLARVPAPAPTTGGYLLDGTEYQIANQERLKPGVYTRRTGAGILEAQANLARGLNFAVSLDPARRRLTTRFGTLNVGTYETLKLMGAADDAIRQTLGAEVFDANVVAPDKVDQAAQKLHQTLFRRRRRHGAPASVGAMKQELRDYFAQTAIDPDTTRETLGRPHRQVTGGLVLDAARKLLRVARGEAAPDNRNAPRFKHFFGPEDQLEARLGHYSTKNNIAFRIQGKIDRKNQVRQVMNNRTFGDPVTRFFTEGSLSNATEQNNPLSILGEANKTTVLGEGGIPSTRSVPEDARSLEPSSLHFHDPVQTPESDRVGITLHTGIDTERAGKTLTTKVREATTGRVRQLPPETIYQSVVAFPDQYQGTRPKGAMVKTIHQGEIGQRPAQAVRYVFDRPQGAFAIAANMVPFLDATQPTRALTASKQMEQAVALTHREVPLVQVADGKGSTFEREVGRSFSVAAPVDGVVDRVETDRLVLRDRRGQRHTVELWDNYPLNQGTFLSEQPLVEKGTPVKRGQVIADSNYTQGGTLALGTNLRTAYLPYRGLTFEDAVVISEGAAKKLTSEHLYKNELLVDERTALSKRKFKAHVPEVLTQARDGKLDDDGVIQKGQTVEKDDVLVAALREEHVTPEDTILSKLRKSRARPWKDRSLRWDHDHPGTVTDVVRTGDKVKVFVKTHEPAREGDKLVGRHGNKGIITRIIPDGEMLQDAQGKPIDLIMDPHTVPSRINVGQNMENALGKVARKQGQPQKVENFGAGSHLDRLQALLQAEGLHDKETVFDPRTNQKIPNIQVGHAYINKLKHQVEKKFGVRNMEGYDLNLQPKGGTGGAQSLDRLTMYGLLAHDARANLREMSSTTKTEKNDELWLRAQAGMSLPPPKPTFAYDKFQSLIKGMGVNIKQEGPTQKLVPLTDKEVAGLSRGAIKNPLRAINRNTMTPEAGGLFDPEVTGGLRGEHWAHIDLAETIPNPVMERGILALTGLKRTEYDAILSGQLAVDDQGQLKGV